jgi:hypothetical protein
MSSDDFTRTASTSTASNINCGQLDLMLYRAVAETQDSSFDEYEVLADRGYVQSDIPALLAKVRRLPAWLSQHDRVLVRTWHALLERGRVLTENVFARISQWQLIGRRFRSSLARHAEFAIIAASCTQLQLMLSPIRDPAESDAHACIFDEDTQAIVALGLLMAMTNID